MSNRAHTNSICVIPLTVNEFYKLKKIGFEQQKPIKAVWETDKVLVSCCTSILIGTEFMQLIQF